MKNVVEQTKILEIISGSFLYGTNVETSDQDFVGVFIAPKEYYLGLSTVEEVDLSIVSKLENGKNAPDAVDRKFYELRKLIKLITDNNPNCMEMLYPSDQCVVYKNSIAQTLLDNAHLFPHKGLKKKFLGYASGQLHKANIKVDNYDSLNSVLDWLRSKQQDFSHNLLAEFRNEKIKGLRFHEHNANVGDISISLTDKLSKVYNKIGDRLSKVGNREELYTKYGMDTKFLSHACRLLLEGKELLTTGKLEYPLEKRKFLLDIRNGEYTSNQIISYAENLMKEIEDDKFEIVVPDKPNYKQIEELMISMIEESWRQNG